MKKFSTYLLVTFMVFFCLLRVVITLMNQMGNDFLGIKPWNPTYEIIILFVNILCFILVAKRKILGCLIYLTAHALYFGADITEKLKLITNGVNLTLEQSMDMFFSIIGIILPIAVLLDFILDTTRKENPKDKKTDWFYNNKEFDRKLDDRRDKNNYRTL